MSRQDSAEQVTQEQLREMSPQDIVAAREAGRLDDLLRNGPQVTDED